MAQISYGTITVVDTTDGVNSATVYLYQRSASTPSVPSGDITYTFATKSLSGSLGNWVTSIPTGTDPCYVIAATAVGNTPTDVIASSEWSTPIQFNGSDGAKGINQATIYLYKRGTSVTKPSTTVTYTFSTGVLSVEPDGWTRNIPSTDSNKYPCWVTTAVAIGTGTTYSLTSSAWSTPTKMVEDGVDGVSVTNVTSTNNTADGGTSVVTITLSDGTTKTFNVKNGNTGATAQWYYGTALTHTSGTATLATTSTSGVVVGSMYLNPDTSLCYKCTAISGTTATWTYAGDLTTGVLENIEDTLSDMNSNIEKALVQSTWYAECSTAAGTAAKVATITPATTAFKLQAGVIVNVKFTNTNTATVGDLTLNVNNKGAGSIKYINNNTLGNIPGVGYLLAGTMYQFRYDGANWIVELNYNTNTDTIGAYGAGSLKAGSNKIYNYSLVMRVGTDTWESFTTSGGTGTSKARNTHGFYYDKIYFVNENNTRESGVSTGSEVFSAYSIDLRYSTNCGTTLTTGKPVYLIGTISNNLFYLDATWWTQSEPTTENGKYYIFIGIAYNTSSIRFVGGDTKVYQYKGGAFRTLADSALTSANGKNAIFHQDSAPSSSTNSLKIGDTWFDTDDGNKMYQWDGDSWEPEQYGTNAIADVAITSAKIDDLAVTNAKIANTTIEYGKIKSIDAATITVNQIKANQLDVNDINAAGTLHVNSANIDGNITIGKVTNLQSTLEAKANADGANGREQIIYHSAASAVIEDPIDPSSVIPAVSATTTWVTDNTGDQNKWTTVRPVYSAVQGANYPVLFVATQRQTVAQMSGTTCTCTTPVVDQTTTVIDGGHITTGTIDADVVNVVNLNASELKAGKAVSPSNNNTYWDLDIGEWQSHGQKYIDDINRENFGWIQDTDVNINDGLMQIKGEHTNEWSYASNVPTKKTQYLKVGLDECSIFDPVAAGGEVMDSDHEEAYADTIEPHGYAGIRLEGDTFKTYGKYVQMNNDEDETQVASEDVCYVHPFMIISPTNIKFDCDYGETYAAADGFLFGISNSSSIQPTDWISTQSMVEYLNDNTAQVDGAYVWITDYYNYNSALFNATDYEADTWVWPEITYDPTAEEYGISNNTSTLPTTWMDDQNIWSYISQHSVELNNKYVWVRKYYPWRNTVYSYFYNKFTTASYQEDYDLPDFTSFLVAPAYNMMEINSGFSNQRSCIRYTNNVRSYNEYDSVLEETVCKRQYTKAIDVEGSERDNAPMPYKPGDRMFIGDTTIYGRTFSSKKKINFSFPLTKPLGSEITGITFSPGATITIRSISGSTYLSATAITTGFTWEFPEIVGDLSLNVFFNKKSGDIGNSNGEIVTATFPVGTYIEFT